MNGTDDGAGVPEEAVPFVRGVLLPTPKDEDGVGEPGTEGLDETGGARLWSTSAQMFSMLIQ